MLLVETYIGPSDIHGIGLFAAERIKKGTPVWEYNQNTSQIFWKKQFLSVCNDLSLPAIWEFIDHSYIKEGNVYYLNDRTKFINHSIEPNIAFKSTKLEVAIKDIDKGDEITENYSLSYDKNDFFFWDLSSFQGTKDTLISYLREQLTRNVRPQTSFLVE